MTQMSSKGQRSKAIPWHPKDSSHHSGHQAAGFRENRVLLVMQINLVWRCYPRINNYNTKRQYNQTRLAKDGKRKSSSAYNANDSKIYILFPFETTNILCQNVGTQIIVHPPPYLLTRNWVCEKKGDKGSKWQGPA